MAPSSPSERASFSSPSETPPQYERPEYAVPNYDAPHEAPLPPESPKAPDVDTGSAPTPPPQERTTCQPWGGGSEELAPIRAVREIDPAVFAYCCELKEQHHKVLEMGRGCNILWAVLSPRKEQ